MADFSYTTDGLFVRLLPNDNGQAADAWRKVAEHFPSCVIPVSAWDGTRRQLKAAGFTVQKHRPERVDDDDLLAALTA
jgi:hypothetical protein